MHFKKKITTDHEVGNNVQKTVSVLSKFLEGM